MHLFNSGTYVGLVFLKIKTDHYHNCYRLLSLCSHTLTEGVKLKHWSEEPRWWSETFNFIRWNCADDGPVWAEHAQVVVIISRYR